MRRIGTMRLRRRSLLFAATALASLGLASTASAATFTVNDSRDLPQSTSASAGSCVSTASTCTLRAAVQAANENGGSNTINVPAGTYNLTASATNKNPNDCMFNAGGFGNEDQSAGDLKVNPCNNSTSVTVIGAGSGVTVVNGQNNNRIFELWPNGSLDVQKMTLENGNGIGSDDTTSPVNLPDGDGGAIESDGHLSAESVTFTGNSVTTANSCNTCGGAVDTENVPGSTGSFTGDVFQNNTAPYGGAIDTNAPNDVTIAFSLLQANSSSQDGGAIEADGNAAGLTLNFDDLVQNVTASGDTGGGGVAWFGNGAVNVTNSLFRQNQAAGGDGGGFLSDSSVSSPVNISNTSFDGNTGNSAGGLADYGSNALTLTQDRFSGNQVSGDGGAAELDTYFSTLTTITSSEFDGNSAADGGALDWDNGYLALLGDSFVLNTAANGGALYADSGPDTSPSPPCGRTPSTICFEPFTMYDSTMSRNTASTEGGAIDVQTGRDGTPFTMINDTIAFNNAPSGAGGGINNPLDFVSGGSQSHGFGVENTTIAENSGGDCSTQFEGTPDESGTTPDDTGNNNDGDQTCFGGTGGPNDKTGVNPLLSNPADNGGPAAGGPGDTETIQTDAEQSGSPTVDAGNNNGCPSTDERGVSRPKGSACDIGAFEFGANPTTTTSTSTLTPPPPNTSVPPPPKPPKPKGNGCGKGKHKSRGKCVKNKRHKKHRRHKKHKRHHKRHKK